MLVRRGLLVVTGVKDKGGWRAVRLFVGLTGKFVTACRFCRFA